MDAKFDENDSRIKAIVAQTYKANEKSDYYLLRHFFADFANICQSIFFPNLL